MTRPLRRDSDCRLSMLVPEQINAGIRLQQGRPDLPPLLAGEVLRAMKANA